MTVTNNLQQWMSWWQCKQEKEKCLQIALNIEHVTPWNITNYKSMFNYIYHIIWLYGWLEWVEVWLELVMCEFLDVDVELCGVLLSYVEIMRF